jgi:hypothetical protein
MNTYTWNIVELFCIPSLDNLSNVVSGIHYTITGEDDSTPPIASTIYGLQDILYNPDESFVPYENLTRDQVITWLNEAIGSDGILMIQNNIDSQIYDIKNPPTITPPLPWDTI